MYPCSILAFLPDAPRLRLSHNTCRSSGESVRTFLRRKMLSHAFASRSELRLAVETNELWMLETWTATGERRVYAAPQFSSLAARAAGMTQVLREEDSSIRPPLPRHDFGLCLEGREMGDLGERWTMRWHERTPTGTSQLEARSADELLLRALHVDARSASETIAAVRRVFGLQ